MQEEKLSRDREQTIKDIKKSYETKLADKDV